MESLIFAFYELNLCPVLNDDERHRICLFSYGGHPGDGDGEREKISPRSSFALILIGNSKKEIYAKDKYSCLLSFLRPISAEWLPCIYTQSLMHHAHTSNCIQQNILSTILEPGNIAFATMAQQFLIDREYMYDSHAIYLVCWMNEFRKRTHTIFVVVVCRWC